MVKIFKISLLFLTTLIFLPPLLSAQSKLQRLETTIKKIEPFTCHFTQVYFDAFQNREAVSEGLFSFKQPGLMKWEYQSPEEMLFIVGSQTAWLYDPILENVTIQDLDQVSGIRTMRFLSKNESISQHFKETKPKTEYLDKVKNLESIFLVPIEKNQSLAELQLAYNPKKNQIHQFVLVDQNRNYRKITLTQIQVKQGLKESDFEFTVTDSMEVIEGFAN